MINNIVFLVSQYFTERDYHRYGVDLLMSCGFKVVVWDISKIIHPQTINALKNTFDIKNRNNIIRFNAIKDVVDLIKHEEDRTYFLSMIKFTFKTIPIFHAITRFGYLYGCTGYYTKGIFPFSSEKTEKSYFVRNTMSALLPRLALLFRWK